MRNDYLLAEEVEDSDDGPERPTKRSRTEVGKSTLLQGIEQEVLRMGIERHDMLTISEYEGDVNQPLTDGLTPLHVAAKTGNSSDIVSLLIEKYKADINVRDREGNTPLLTAAKHGHADVIALLVDRYKADFNVVNKYGETPQSASIASVLHQQIVMENYDLVPFQICKSKYVALPLTMWKYVPKSAIEFNYEHVIPWTKDELKKFEEISSAASMLVAMGNVFTFVFDTSTSRRFIFNRWTKQVDEIEASKKETLSLKSCYGRKDQVEMVFGGAFSNHFVEVTRNRKYSIYGPLLVEKDSIARKLEAIDSEKQISTLVLREEFILILTEDGKIKFLTYQEPTHTLTSMIATRLAQFQRSSHATTKIKEISIGYDRAVLIFENDEMVEIPGSYGGLQVIKKVEKVHDVSLGFWHGAGIGNEDNLLKTWKLDRCSERRQESWGDTIVYYKRSEITDKIVQVKSGLYHIAVITEDGIGKILSFRTVRRAKTPTESGMAKVICGGFETIFIRAKDGKIFSHFQTVPSDIFEARMLTSTSWKETEEEVASAESETSAEIEASAE